MLAALFDWSTVLKVPPQAQVTGGSQILHFKCLNKALSSEAERFVEEHLRDAVVLTSDAEVLRFGSDSVVLKGSYMELGVCTGKTINFIAALNPHQKIYGFDSFEGLPEPWVRDDKVFPTGTFGFLDSEKLPPVLHNVTLVQGLFSETLPQFSDEPIAFLHVDCDLYSSTKIAFDVLPIVPGTVIVFDELYNYPGYERHEWKALQEFLVRTGYGVKFLAYNANHEQVALIITKSHLD